ncbi:uncharacterized protein [Apostichopus japonicus]|uniref:uncharacterized protein isoform X2 n=1 Tax=Stichopus japonicus TaxID=307972 RepID=UPI003AB48280
MKFEEHLDHKVFKANKEMAKVADLKAMFNQDLPVGKPPPAVRKPPVAAGKPKVAVKVAPAHVNGASKVAPMIPNGLSANDLSRGRLKSFERSSSPSGSPEKQKDDSSSQGNIDFRSRLRKVQDPASSPPKVTPKPGVKPPVAKASKPSITPKPRLQPPTLVPSQNDQKTPGSVPVARSPSKTGSVSSLKSDSSKEGIFQLAALPSLEVLGSPPRKPPKPSYVRLPPPTGVSEAKSRKPAAFSRGPPPLPSKQPEPITPVEEDFDGTYDDVAKPPPPLPPTTNRPSLKNRVSMIQPMDSDDEMEDADDLYDDGSSALPNDGVPPPSLPSIDTLPVHHQTSAGSSSSHIQTSGTSEYTGSGGDSGEIYDPIDGDCDELYEPLDIDQAGNAVGSDAATLEKEREAERKRQEKLKKDQERLQKKEEERRKKEEKEEKKKKEKADKELKKKFKVKGDWTVLGTGTSLQDIGDENDKFSVICIQGESLDIIRKDGPNPPGKWLVKNKLGDPGYIDSHLVHPTDDGDFGDVYDAVGLSGDGDFQDVYDTAS